MLPKTRASSSQQVFMIARRQHSNFICAGLPVVVLVGFAACCLFGLRWHKQSQAWQLHLLSCTCELQSSWASARRRPPGDRNPSAHSSHVAFKGGGLSIFGRFFRGRSWIFLGFLVLCFPVSLIFCFSALLLLCLHWFSAVPAFLLFAFPASLLFLRLCFSAFCFSCFAFLLLCFPCFSAFVLLYLSTSTSRLFLFFSHVFLLPYFLLLCFFASCLYCLFVFHFLLLYSVLFVSDNVVS